MGEDLWRGTSDAEAVIRLRADSTTPSQRWLWWEESLDLAAELGVLQAVRARRQAESDSWWSGTSATALPSDGPQA